MREIQFSTTPATAPYSGNAKLSDTMKWKRHRLENRQILRGAIDRVIVVAYREDVTRLVSSLVCEGFKVDVLRPDYTKEEMTYSKNSRTFLNHCNAWQKAIDITGYTLICEADFVPCRGIGDFEVFWPLDNARAWGYLYQGSPRLLAIVGSQRFLRGHAAPLVCYVVNSKVASLMLMFFDYAKKTYDFRSYFMFDAYLQRFIRALGAEAFISLYHYGEHGGLPNSEHATLGFLSNNGQHRADNLMSSLHFLPTYANGNYLSFIRVRLVAHLLGFVRLMAGRWIARPNVYHLSLLDILKMYLIGVRRLISLPF
jgi:hypothetical protein